METPDPPILTPVGASKQVFLKVWPKSKGFLRYVIWQRDFFRSENNPKKKTSTESISQARKSLQPPKSCYTYISCQAGNKTSTEKQVDDFVGNIFLQ